MKKIKDENRKRYSADFETLSLTREQIEAGQRCYVWAWAVCDCFDINKIEYGTSIETFFKYMFSLDDGSVIYFHNQKFDGSFIISWLLKNGFKQFVGDKYDCPKNHFIAMTTGMGVFYSITINYNNNCYLIYDSLKKLPFTVKQLAKTLGYEEGKGEIDYTEYREEGGTLSETDKDYIRRDVQIVAKALNDIYFKNGMYKLTIGSDCLKFYKSITKQFNYYFATLDPAEDQFVRNSYRGGFCYLNPKYAGEVLTCGGIHIDKNSMYPSMMDSSSKNILPVGRGKYYTGKYIKNNLYPLYVCHIKCALELKEGFIPTIQIKNNLMYKQNEYITTTNGEVVDLYLTSIDYEMLVKHYKCYLYDPDIECIDYIDGYMYQGVLGLFDKYINHWYKIKEEATKEGNKALRQLAKLQLNNLYGKMAQNPNGSYLLFNLDENGVLKREPIEENRETLYIPAASFITSYSRFDLIENGIQHNYDRFIYCDTDSIVLKGYEPAKNIKLDKTALGCWDCEAVWSRAKFLRQKTYAEEVNGQWSYKCAGLPNSNDTIKNIDDFYIGAKFENAKLMSKQVNGGIVLLPTDYVIKAH